MGRFAWKSEYSVGGSPYKNVLGEAEEKSASWWPLQIGLFQGRLERFREIHSKLGPIVSNMRWK